MPRSLAVTLAAIMVLLGSALTVLLGLLLVVIAFLETSAPLAAVRGILLAEAVMFAAFGILGLATGVDLLRLKRWARISVMVFAGLLCLMGATAGLVILIIPIPAPPSPPPNFETVMRMVRLGMAGFYFLLLALGAWWLYLFNKASVKAEFGEAPPAAITPSAPPLPAGPPVSIIIIAGLILVGVPALLLVLALPLPAVLLGQVFAGWPAKLFYLVFAALHLVIGIGLLQLKPWARLLAIGYYSFTVVNVASFMLAPGAMEKIMAASRSWLPISAPMPTLSPSFYALMMVPSLVLLGAILWVLVTRKAAFEQAR